ncbi:hypothetical protein FOCG_00881 [Fusarium oxysporum f. sp. radicis-lycopersici 26381]|uniref:Uncharacterized protein n=1 Tax=Fusarium oxysporum Fo47 TaxID=660027 RepID=W9KK20_FUSOX|nr:hypothetical protein FOZG_05381 [Fusarium oxysporum Fo47]EWZ98359.1 hypothetical protein FOWG_02504 [Fusarium oxysporum f. sp. lycopersici MN25]EXL62088.1 hypothetical protein FOCG_00881 [Fusarium oxysporum f. sp. radicis-lycopersici 26381]
MSLLRYGKVLLTAVQGCGHLKLEISPYKSMANQERFSSH